MKSGWFYLLLLIACGTWGVLGLRSRRPPSLSAIRSRRRSRGLDDVRGEWWIDEGGQAQFADGDVGEMNHEMYVIDLLTHQILDHFGIDIDDYAGTLDNYEDQIVEWFQEEKGIDYSERDDLRDAVVDEVTYSFNHDPKLAKEAVNVAMGKADARDYAIKHLGWIRVNGNNVQLLTMDAATLATLANGLYDAVGEDEEQIVNEVFYIESMNPRKVFSDVPLADILDRNLSAVYRHADRGALF